MFEFNYEQNRVKLSWPICKAIKNVKSRANKVDAFGKHKQFQQSIKNALNWFSLKIIYLVYLITKCVTYLNVDVYFCFV